MGLGWCSPTAHPTKGVTSHLNVQLTLAVGKALRPWPLPLAAVLSPEPLQVPYPHQELEQAACGPGGERHCQLLGADKVKP